MASEGNRNGLGGMLVLWVSPEEQKVGVRNGESLNLSVSETQTQWSRA